MNDVAIGIDKKMPLAMNFLMENVILSETSMRKMEWSGKKRK